MLYADYLSKHSYLHLLARNTLYALYPRLAKGLTSSVYEEQLKALEQALRK